MSTNDRIAKLYDAAEKLEIGAAEIRISCLSYVNSGDESHIADVINMIEHDLLSLDIWLTIDIPILQAEMT